MNLDAAARLALLGPDLVAALRAEGAQAPTPQQQAELAVLLRPIPTRSVLTPTRNGSDAHTSDPSDTRKQAAHQMPGPDLTPATTPIVVVRAGRHHTERPGAIPCTVFVPVRPDLPSGRRRASITARMRRRITLNTGGAA